MIKDGRGVRPVAQGRAFEMLVIREEVGSERIMRTASSPQTTHPKNKKQKKKKKKTPKTKNQKKRRGGGGGGRGGGGGGGGGEGGGGGGGAGEDLPFAPLPKRKEVLEKENLSQYQCSVLLS